MSENEYVKPSLMIATPMYGGMCTGHYVHGLLGAVSRMRDLGVPVYWAQIMNESLITRARNELVRMFLDAGFDYLMFIDADIHFDGQDLATLMAADKDIVCGIYPKKEVDWARVNAAAKEGRDNLQDYGAAFVMNMVDAEASSDSDGLIEVRHGGTGFMLIKRQVFIDLMPHVSTYRTSTFKNPETGEYLQPLVHEFFATSIADDGALLSEDYHFCALWRRHGGKIYANPFIKLSHVGTYVFQGDILRAGGNIK